VARVRAPAVAGRFYPGTAAVLAATVDRMLDQAGPPPDGEPLAAAYVVPHAGYRYSGPAAATVYTRLRRHAGNVARVVLIGPAHFVPLTGYAASGADAWATPLGDLPVAAQPDGLPVDDAPHAQEHSLEVQLPFLWRALGRAVPIVPVAVGRADPDQVATQLATVLATGPPAVVLCSTDLSHYLDLATASAQDARTAEAVLDLAPDRIGTRDACGSYALRGLLAWARSTGLRPELLELTTSAAATGDTNRVVGYGSFALHRPTG